MVKLQSYYFTCFDTILSDWYSKYCAFLEYFSPRFSLSSRQKPWETYSIFGRFIVPVGIPCQYQITYWHILHIISVLQSPVASCLIYSCWLVNSPHRWFTTTPIPHLRDATDCTSCAAVLHINLEHSSRHINQRRTQKTGMPFSFTYSGSAGQDGWMDCSFNDMYSNNSFITPLIFF